MHTNTTTIQRTVHLNKIPAFGVSVFKWFRFKLLNSYHVIKGHDYSVISSQIQYLQYNYVCVCVCVKGLPKV